MIDESLLRKYQQDHIIQFSSELSDAQLAQLASQINTIDFDLLKQLTASQEHVIDWGALAAKAEPPQAACLDATSMEDRERARQVGAEAIQTGQVGVILVAGGQGSRLGFDKPKGMFPIGPLSSRTLFQMHADRLMAVSQKYRTAIPMYVMTSPATDEETREYFTATNNCGIPTEQLKIFCQGTMPAVAMETGKLLLAQKDSLALSPDGHGGLVAALQKNGCLAEAKAKEIKYFYYAQVDNPLAALCDPELIGHHILQSSQLTTQVVRKRFATEKVGNVVSIDGKTQIIEYSDLPEEFATQETADGELQFWAGNIAIHVFDRAFLESVVGCADGLPFHKAHKKVAYVNDNGDLIKPDTPNAIKFERFVFDLLPLAERSFVVEGQASQIFAPVKNADGAEVDTPSTAQNALSELHKSWLVAAGVSVDESVTVEIHPGWAIDAEEVANRGDLPEKIATDLYIEP